MRGKAHEGGLPDNYIHRCIGHLEQRMAPPEIFAKVEKFDNSRNLEWHPKAAFVVLSAWTFVVHNSAWVGQVIDL